MPMTRVRPLPAIMLALALASCTSTSSDCTEIACDSTLRFSYGAVSVDEPYLLTISYGDASTTVACLDPAAPPSSTIDCDEDGFELTPFVDDPGNVTVTIVLQATDEELASVTVPVGLIEDTEINGPGCPGGCLTFFGSLDDEPDREG